MNEKKDMSESKNKEISGDSQQRLNGGEGFLNQFLDRIGKPGAFVVSIIFIVGIWSTYNDFPLGELMTKHAEANLEQNKMQFKSQMEMQKLQFQAANSSNEKLDVLIASVSDVTERMDAQSVRMGKLEKTVSLIIEWACSHEKSSPPDYCEALADIK